MFDNFFEFFEVHRIAAVVIFLFLYAFTVILVSFLIRYIYKKRHERNYIIMKTKNESSIVITSYDIFPKDKEIENTQMISAQLGKVNHRIFSHSIFVTIHNGLKNNEELSHISDCDEEYCINV